MLSKYELGPLLLDRKLSYSTYYILYVICSTILYVQFMLSLCNSKVFFLLVSGGVTTIYMRALNNVESFCCERSAWIRGVATLPSPLSGHGAVTLPPASLM